MDQFGDDPILHLTLATKSKNAPDWMEATVSLGLPQARISSTEPLIDWHRQAALTASRWVVEKLRGGCEERNQQLMVILSYPRNSVRHVIDGQERWDQGFLDWLSEQGILFVDILATYHQAWTDSRLKSNDFLSAYFNGYHSPYGNFFMAEALRKPLLELLVPAPPAYRETPVNGSTPS